LEFLPPIENNYTSAKSDLEVNFNFGLKKLSN